MSWKNCSCALFDDDRLLARAEQIVDRDGPRARGEARDAEVREVARAVEANHACTHPSTLQVRQGNLRCEACREVQDIYVNECPTCRLRECIIGAKTKGLLGSGKSSCSSMEVLRLSCQPTVAVGQGGNVDMASPMARATAIATVIAIVTARAMRIAIVIARAMAMSIATARAMGIATVMTRAPRGRASPAHVTRQVIL